MEYLVIAVTLVQDAVEMVAVGIGDENLSEIGTRYQVDNRLYPWASNLSKISSSSKRGVVLDTVRRRKSNWANLRAKTKVLFCP